MKKFEGMIFPVLVCAEDGANGDCAPAPSSFIESGGTRGILNAIVGIRPELSIEGGGARQKNQEAGRGHIYSAEASDSRFDEHDRDEGESDVNPQHFAVLKRICRG